VKERLLKYAKYAPYVGYPLFYLVMLVVFIALLVPWDKVRERAVAQFNADQRATGGKYELQVDEMSGYWLSGARMKGVRLLSPPTEPGKPPSKIDIDEATVRYALLIGHGDIGFHVNAFGGEASGTWGQHGNDRSIEVELDSVDVGAIDALTQVLGVPLKGKVNGKVKLAMPEGKASKGSGTVALEIQDVSVGDGKAKLKGALALPRIDVGTITLSGDARDGTLKITKLVAGGKDLELQGEGRVVMRELATDSLCDATIRFKLNDGYRNKNDLTKSLFGSPGSTMPALFEMDPKVKQSKRPDGFYAWAMRGKLGNPDFTPAGGGGPTMNAPMPTMPLPRIPTFTGNPGQ
jgi:type II secretion system protein N